MFCGIHDNSFFFFLKLIITNVSEMFTHTHTHTHTADTEQHHHSFGAMFLVTLNISLIFMLLD